MEKKSNNKKVWIITGIAVFAVLCIFAVVALLNSKLNSDDGAPGDNNSEDTVAFDPNLIPTYEELNRVMGRAVEDLYGDTYEEVMSADSVPTVKIPNTQITFKADEVGDAADTMAITAMAFVRNPYAKSDDHPVPLKSLIGDTDGTVRSLPDGSKIDLATVVQNYSDLKLFVNRDDSTKVTVEGYCNGDYFTESINLMGLYEQYYIN